MPTSRPPSRPTENRRTPRTGRKAPDRETPGLKARKIAAEVLARVIHGRRPLDEELHDARGHPDLHTLGDKDRALVRAILGLALRRRGQIAAVLEMLLDRPIPEKTGAVMTILHVAGAQILFMEVPDRAAVDIAVADAGRDPATRRYKGLVNAVLRRMSDNSGELVEKTGQVWRNTPVWLFAGWQKAYGEEQALAIAAMHQHEPNLDLSVKADPQAWAQRLGGQLVVRDSIRLVSTSGRIEALAGYEEGAWWVQDAAASLPAKLLGNVTGKRVADLCAAPGGKTAQLAQAGAKVTAFDISKKRLERLAENLARLGLQAEVVAADLLDHDPETLFDAILLDAPCTATGTIRRHPEVAWNRRKEDIDALAERQAALLGRAATWLSPDGTLVYCTCSLEPAEGEKQIEAFLSANPDFRREPIREAETGVPGTVTDAGDLRSLPSSLPREPAAAGGLDGFFAARLVRRTPADADG
ncbi:RsmB/NOP family class I SAM-dependent RNA methyltransferase [Stappia sp. ES.058]|uniref:RsmB/NOP family class I SAM-dependent RNA methyltransferase n=1 Tax=Stappia sp. ES.058 TaxID=1881061 RepID=UPI00087BD810|nr:transcription antitermination factor NusB [Stappia sp. ES.058]SDU41659.1 16S rRNA (cytosine967-C5)-methyltransferase [Stappia sp. ES.058]